LAEADEDTNTKVDGDTRTGLEVSSAANPRRKTRAAAANQSATTVAAKVTAVKAAEKKKRKRKASPPPTVEMPVVETPTIPMSQSREVESEEEEEDDEATEEPPVIQDRSVRRSLSPLAKRQRELVEKTMEDALRQSLEAQRAVAATQANMPVLNRPRFFRPKPRVSAVTR
jgi:hypothetical protein